MKKMNKLLMGTVLSLCSLGMLSGCVKTDPTGKPTPSGTVPTPSGTVPTTPGEAKEITVWTFSSELKEIAEKYYTPATNNKVKVVIKSSVTQIQSELNSVIEMKSGVPDVIALEAAVVADFTSKSSSESVLLSLDDIKGTEEMYDYTKAVATSTDGKLLGLSWQATPGGFFYKRSTLEKVGVSEQKLEEYLSTWEGYLQLAKICKSKEVAICSSITDPVKVFLSARKNPWVVDDTLQLEEVMFGGKTQYNCFDVVRELHQADYTHQASDRGPRWVSDINSDNTLGYFCSSWGLNFDLMPNATVQSGWRMCKAPVDYFKGGTWLAIPKLSKNISEAKQFISYVTTNTDFLTKRGNDTGDFMNNKAAMQNIIKNYKCSFLDGQNHLELLYDIAEKINGKLISPYDAAIDSFFTTAVANFAMEELDTSEVEEAREDYIEQFTDLVSQRFKSLYIPE